MTRPLLVGGVLAPAAFRPLHFPDHPAPVGHLPLDAAKTLLRHGVLSESGSRLTLAADADISVRLEDARALLAGQGHIGPPRHEAMPVRATFDGPVLGRIDRSALRIFGFWASKVHVNGLSTIDGEPRPAVWLSRRSSEAEAFPGAFDTLVAGGQDWQASRMDTVRREAREEAGIAADDLNGLTHIRDLPVQYVTEQGFHQELLIIYDLPLGADFVPRCDDGEIEGHVLLGLQALAAGLARDIPFKLNSRLVCLDLLERMARACRPG